MNKRRETFKRRHGGGGDYDGGEKDEMCWATERYDEKGGARNITLHNIILLYRSSYTRDKERQIERVCR